MTTVFTSAECNELEKVLDIAWEIYLRKGRLDAYNLDTARAALTRAILEGFEQGERNPRRLAIAAVASMAQYEAVIMRRRPAPPAESCAKLLLGAYNFSHLKKHLVSFRTLRCRRARSSCAPSLQRAASCETPCYRRFVMYGTALSASVQ